MKKFFAIAMLGTLTLVSCKNNTPTSSTSGDAAFQKVSEDFLAGYLKWRPQASVALGFHEYDGKMTDFSKASIDTELNRLKSYDKMLAGIDTASLSTQAYYDSAF